MGAYGVKGVKGVEGIEGIEGMERWKGWNVPCLALITESDVESHGSSGFKPPAQLSLEIVLPSARMNVPRLTVEIQGKGSTFPEIFLHRSFLLRSLRSYNLDSFSFSLTVFGKT